MSETLNRAALARMKHAINEAQQLVVVLDKIKNGNAPVQEMANARGLVAKICQSVHEASAYYSAYLTIREDGEFIPMSRPAIKKQPKNYMRRRNKAVEE